MFKKLLFLFFAAPLLLVGCGQSEEYQYETLHIGLVDIAEGKDSLYDDALTLNSRLALARHSDDGIIRQGTKRVRIQFITVPVSNLPEAPRQMLYETVNTYGAGVIVGAARSRISAALAATAEKLEIPYLAATASSHAATYGFRYSFSTTPPANVQALHHAAFLRDSLKARRIAMLVEEDTLFSANFADELRQTHLDNGGDIPLLRFYSATEDNLEEKIRDIVRVKADAVVLRGNSPGCLVVADALAREGYDKPLLCVHCKELAVIKDKAPEYPLPIYTLSYWNPKGTSPLSQEYIRDFTNVVGMPPAENDALAYDTMLRVIDAVQKASGLKPEEIREALAAQTAFSGVLGNYVLNPDIRPGSIWRIGLLDGKLGIDEILFPGIYRKLSSQVASPAADQAGVK